MPKENHNKGALGDINRLRKLFGMSALPEPGIVECPLCLTRHRSENPKNEKFCTSCRNSTVFKAGLH
jgi:hypothetical protein